MPLRRFPDAPAQKLTLRARPLVPKGQLCNRKTIFPHFWRRKQDEDAPAKPTTMEAPLNKPKTQEPIPSGPRGELLNYEYIYRTVGIMSPGAGYGIQKGRRHVEQRSHSRPFQRSRARFCAPGARCRRHLRRRDAHRRNPPPECADILRDRPEQTTGGLRGTEGEGEHPHRGRNGKNPYALRRARASESRPSGKGKRSVAQLADGHAA